ncbi:MAG: hypothetical protein FJX77_03040 [Armatimonadetes bacterium]|nr:hypothetical protein [Armatimonadota bacterium]
MTDGQAEEYRFHVAAFRQAMEDPALCWGVWAARWPWGALVDLWFNGSTVVFAEAVGVSLRTVHRWKKGVCRPSLRVRRRVNRELFRGCLESDARIWDLWLAQRHRFEENR